MESPSSVAPEDALVAAEKKQFGFPFQPYSIQLSFMREVFNSIENNNVAILESPTGTGKTLSLLCAAISWLKLHKDSFLDSTSVIPAKKDEEDKTQNTSSKSTVPDWVMEHAKKKKDEEKKRKLMEIEEKRSRLQNRLHSVNKRQKLDSFGSSSSSSSSSSKSAEELDDEFLPKDYRSDEELQTNETAEAIDEILKRFQSSSDEESEDKDEEGEDVVEPVKILYCSRTHSQLSQVMNELKKLSLDIKAVSLASRKNLCINEDVLRSKSQDRINEKCLDMQKGKDTDAIKQESDQKKKKNSKKSLCPFYSTVNSLSDHILVKVQDIEEVVLLGKKMKACSYYGSRKAAQYAELITLPYNTLLHKTTRESIELDIKGNIIIIDEAHNLIDAINNMYSVELSLPQMKVAHGQLSQYEEKYRNRLKAKNLRYIRQILFLIEAFVKFVSLTDRKGEQNEDNVSSEIMTINDFLCSTKTDNLNLFKVEKYFQRSEIVKKVNGFFDKAYELQLNLHNTSGPVSTSADEEDGMVMRHAVLSVVERLIVALTNADQNGRMLLNRHCTPFLSVLFVADSNQPVKDSKKSSIKFLLLNAEIHFAEILQQAKAVILAGGTLQPTSDILSQLLLKVPQEKIRSYSCGHVIPAENLLVAALKRFSGPSGQLFDFTFENRKNPSLIEELGRTLINMCNIVPDGIVCFFPSYSYEELVVNHWKEKGLLQQIESKKQFIREPRKSTKVEESLKQYQKQIESCYQGSSNKLKGAILSCIVGGKLSEGINFSDGLGRCVIMVGMPFPNRNDPVLKEKISYITQHSKDKGAGMEYYENLCMKAVNQSIGRSIRHAKDYSTILLLDHRYLNSKISNKLPKWISSSLCQASNFGPSFALIRQFFQGKKEDQEQIEGERAKKHKEH